MTRKQFGRLSICGVVALAACGGGGDEGNTEASVLNSGTVVVATSGTAAVSTTTTTTLPGQPAGLVQELDDYSVTPDDRYPASEMWLTHLTGKVEITVGEVLDDFAIDGVPAVPADGERLWLFSVDLAKSPTQPARDTDPVDVKVELGGNEIFNFQNSSQTVAFVASAPEGEPLVVTMDTMGDTQSVTITDSTAERSTPRPLFYQDEPEGVVFSADQLLTFTDEAGETAETSVEIKTVWRGGNFEPEVVEPSYVNEELTMLAPAGSAYWEVVIKPGARRLGDADDATLSPGENCDVSLVAEDGTPFAASSCVFLSPAAGFDEIILLFEMPDGIIPAAMEIRSLRIAGNGGEVTVAPLSIPTIQR